MFCVFETVSVCVSELCRWKIPDANSQMLSVSPCLFPFLPALQVMILPVLWSQPTSTPAFWKSTSARRTIAPTCQWGLHTNPATSKQHATTESDHVVTEEFVVSDKANPGFFFPPFFTLAVSLRSTAPQDRITHLPRQERPPLGGWCVVWAPLFHYVKDPSHLEPPPVRTPTPQVHLWAFDTTTPA